MEDASSSRYTTTTPPPPPPTIPLQLPDSTTAAAEATALQTHHGPSECPTWLSEVDGPARRGDVKVLLLLLRIVGAVVVVGTSVVVLLVVFLPVSSSHEKNNQQSSDPNGEVVVVVSSSWCLLGSKLTASSSSSSSATTTTTTSSEDRFGHALALSSSSRNTNGTSTLRLAVGAPYAQDRTGKVYMLDWKSNQDNGTNDWVPSSSLSSELVGHEMGDQFGTSLSFHPNGTRLVVGSPFANHNHDDDTSSKSNVGRVQVFDWNKHNSSEDETTTSSSSWSLTWERYGANKFDNMGYSLALAADGSHLAVSARYHDDTTTPNIGQVQVFQWKEESNNNSTWIPVGDANTSSLLQGIDESDRLGESLAFSQNASRLVIGTLYSNGINGTENNVGHVTILDFIPSESSKNNNNNNTWTPMSETKLYGREAGHRFGYSVVLSGDGTRLAARSIYFNVTQDTWVSSVTIYDYDRARREWIPFESDWEPAGGRPVLGDAFGYSMAMSKDGSRLVVAGHEQLYIWEAESSSSSSIPKWKTMECADEPKDESTTTFGYSVALSDDGTILAVGKRHKDAPTDYHVQMYEAC